MMSFDLEEYSSRKKAKNKLRKDNREGLLKGSLRTHWFALGKKSSDFKSHNSFPRPPARGELRVSRED